MFLTSLSLSSVFAFVGSLATAALVFFCEFMHTYLTRTTRGRHSKLSMFIFFALITVIMAADGIVYVAVIKAHSHGTFGFALSVALPTALFYAALITFIAAHVHTMRGTKPVITIARMIKVSGFSYLLMKVAYALAYASPIAAANCVASAVFVALWFAVDLKCFRIDRKKKE